MYSLDTAIVYNAIRTPDGTILQSRGRHDYRTHLDNNGKVYMVDGGLEYLRRSAHGDEQNLSLSLADPHDQVREVVEWGTHGPDGDEPLHYVKIKDMSTDHIKACIENVPSMHPNLREVMKNELLFRGANV